MQCIALDSVAERHDAPAEPEAKVDDPEHVAEVSPASNVLAQSPSVT